MVEISSTSCDSGFTTGPAIPITADCFSWSSQIWCSASASAQMPSQRGHSRKGLPPMTTAFITTRQRGQISGLASATSVRSALAPQCEQNFSPTNIMPKHLGQATVASRAPQCSHRVASVEAAAPHIGQFSVSAGIRFSFRYSLFTIQNSHSAPGDYIFRRNLYFPL
jgi:hypothetical protein